MVDVKADHNKAVDSAITHCRITFDIALYTLLERTGPLFGLLTNDKVMVEFDPEKFDDKYEHYFPQLQRAYKNAFNTMNDAYDSTLIHGIDQQVLNESEPMYDPESGFTIALPDDPYDRLTGVVVDRETFEETLDRYTEEIETELRQLFELTT